jgi:hypothetical protein
MEEQQALKRAPGQGRGVARGVLLSLFLHPIAFVVIAVAGTATDLNRGALIVGYFVVYLGIAQWVYLLPAAWLFRRRGATGAAKGVLIGGGLTMLVNTLCYGLMVNR